MKNLTLNMPLAVPHQRPPSKYASHPYPILIDEPDDTACVSVSPAILNITTVLKRSYADNSADSASVGVLPSAFELRSTIQRAQNIDVAAVNIIPSAIELNGTVKRKNASSVGAVSVTPTTITLDTVVVRNYASDVAATSMTPTSITLGTQE